MIDDHEEGRPPAGDALQARPGDDVRPDHLVGRSGGAEICGHDVAAGRADISEGSVREPVVGALGADQHDQLEHQQGDEEREDKPRDDAAADSTSIDAGVGSTTDTGHDAIVSTRRRSERVIGLAAALLAVIVAVLAIVLTTRHQGIATRQAEVKDTARRFAVALSTYDYRHLDRNTAKVRSMGVGNFQYQYEDVLGANSFNTAVAANQAVATAEAKDGPFVAALSNDDARTLTVVTQTITGKSSPRDQTRNLRIETTLVRTSKGWRVDWVQIS